MKPLQYTIEINASEEHVWETMLDKEKYTIWCSPFCEGAYFEGEWKEGENVKFLAPEKGGTLARVDTYSKPDIVKMTHIAVIDGEGNQDTESDEAKVWVGTKENYTLEDADGKTKVIIDIETTEDFSNMFDENWPQALDILKKICEE